MKTSPAEPSCPADSRTAPSDTGRLTRALLKASISFCLLAGVILFLHQMDAQGFLEHAWADSHLKNQGWFGILLYIALVAALATIAVPRQALSALGGYAFGAVWGSLWATAGLTLSCACVFFYARFMGRASLQRQFKGRIRKFDDFLSRNPFRMTIVIRFLPVGINSLTSLLAGITSIPAPAFIAGSCIGYLPQNIIFALLGSGLRVDPVWSACASGVLFLLSSAIGYTLYRRYATVCEPGKDSEREHLPEQKQGAAPDGKEDPPA